MGSLFITHLGFAICKVHQEYKSDQKLVKSLVCSKKFEFGCCPHVLCLLLIVVLSRYSLPIWSFIRLLCYKFMIECPNGVFFKTFKSQNLVSSASKFVILWIKIECSGDNFIVVVGWLAPITIAWLVNIIIVITSMQFHLQKNVCVANLVKVGKAFWNKVKDFILLDVLTFM